MPQEAVERTDCERVALVARSAAVLRDSGISIQKTFTDTTLFAVAVESSLWELSNPAENAAKFFKACHIDGYSEMPRRLREIRIERALLEQVKANQGI